jgi:hypothetical protein
MYAAADGRFSVVHGVRACSYMARPQLSSGVSWRLIVGADPRTFEHVVNAQPLTCRWRLFVP